MLIVTLGAYGAVIAQNVNNPQITTLHPMHIDNAKIKSVSGAGDWFAFICKIFYDIVSKLSNFSFNSGLLAYRLLHNVDWTDCIHFANECASASLQSFDAVPSTIENIRQGPVLMNHFTVKN
jgi:sugar/nucleoside kinase (ribokinase family)